MKRSDGVCSRGAGALLLTSVLALATACGPDRTGFGRDSGADAALDASGGDANVARDGDAASTDTRPVSSDVTMVPIEGGTMGTDMTIVYAHSGRGLYQFDPRRNPPTVSHIGDFRDPTGTTDATRNPSMTDLAVDQYGNAVAVTRSALYRVDTSTAEVTRVAMLPGTDATLFVALSFVPQGDREVLMGGTRDGTFYEIDPARGTATMRGRLSDNWQFSGDFVSVVGAGTYGTVRRSTTDESDRLALIDFTTGRTTIVGGSSAMVGFGNIYGLGYWRATVFGFDRDGHFVRINTMTGRGTLVETYGPDEVMGGFAGAGSTTVAPTGPG